MFPAHNTKLHRNPCIFVYFFKHQTHFSLSEAFDRRSRKKCRSEHLFCLEWSVRCIQTHALLQKCYILNVPCNAILPEQCTVTEKRSRYPQHILTGGATPATETKREQHGFGCSTSTSLLAASVMLHWKQKRGQKFSLKFPTPLYLGSLEQLVPIFILCTLFSVHKGICTQIPLNLTRRWQRLLNWR